MEPTKLEDHIKKTLKENEIKPSEVAWQKIKGQIGQDAKPKNTGYFRFAIAAGFIGILILSVLYFTTYDTELNQELQIVPQSSTSVADIEKEELSKIPLTEEENTMTEDEDYFEEDEEKSARGAKKESEIQMVVAEDAQLANTAGNQNEASEDSNTLIDTKIGEVMAIVTTYEENKEKLTDLEVDSLLIRAQKEILTEKLINSDKSVNPEALLSEVEEELDQSFRDKILEKLKSGYNKVKTAVADRNN
ncbi:MAG: hypothetical protein JSV59_05865 [Flavobacteriaceae bacterium]|nr:MAG: hypothetical protein JSV59_05865 [Flavobacteriaceae bacterium]